jgi:Type IX secretion system membrane protein PorP/SprF
MKKIFLTLFCFVVSSVIIFSQSAGGSGLSFLKLGFGARNVAMGDAGAAASNDVTSLFYNPAKLANSDNYEIMLMHNQWIQDVKSDILGVKFKIFNLNMAIGTNITSIGNIEIRTRPGDPEDEFTANYSFISISTGFNILNNLSFGTSIKYLYEGLYTDESNGLGFDFGLNYETSLSGLAVSAVTRNLGSMDKLRNEKTKLPNEFRIGPSYNFNLQPDFEISTAAELLKYLQTSDIHFNLGAEVLYNNLIALRGGYQTGYISKGFTGGLGLRWGNLSFDYAISPFQLGLGSGNTISVNFKF